MGELISGGLINRKFTVDFRVGARVKDLSS